MFESGVCVPAIKFNQHCAKRCDYFDALVNYAMIMAAALAIFDAAMYYSYQLAPIPCLRATAFCSYLLIILGHIWGIFYDQQKVQYGYKPNSDYRAAGVILRLVIILILALLSPNRYGDFIDYWEYMSVPKDLAVIVMAVLASVVTLGTVICIAILIMCRIADHRLWQTYIDSEYDISNETPPSFIEYCQKANRSLLYRAP